LIVSVFISVYLWLIVLLLFQRPGNNSQNSTSRQSDSKGGSIAFAASVTNARNGFGSAKR
jgi:hypothetical protein